MSLPIHPDDIGEMNVEATETPYRPLRRVTVTFISWDGTRRYKYEAIVDKHWEDPYTRDKLMLIRVPDENFLHRERV